MTTEWPTGPRRAASRALNISPQGRNGGVIREGLPGDEGQGESLPPLQYHDLRKDMPTGSVCGGMGREGLASFISQPPN